MALLKETIQKTRYSNVIDADGHVLEAPDCWEKYIEAKYKTRAVRVRKDERGYEYVEIGGKPSKFNRHGAIGILGAMGMLSRDNWQWDYHRGWGEVAGFGAVDAKERIQRLDAEGLAAAIIYPTIGLAWETECDDGELRPGDVPRLQPLDRRLVLRQRRPADSGRAPVARRPASGGGGIGARGQGRMQGRMVRAVHR